MTVSVKIRSCELSLGIQMNYQLMIRLMMQETQSMTRHHRSMQETSVQGLRKKNIFRINCEKIKKRINFRIKKSNKLPNKKKNNYNFRNTGKGNTGNCEHVMKITTLGANHVEPALDLAGRLQTSW